MIDVFTPTIRHEGIKIIARCLERQTFQDFRWVIVDHDYSLEWFYSAIPMTLWGKTLYLKPKVQNPVRKYKLWNTRNTAYLFLGNPLVVEIQDYHWFDSTTLEHLWNIYQAEPKALISLYYKIVTFKNYEKALEGDIYDEDVEIIDYTARKFADGKPGLHQSNVPYLVYEMNVSSIPLDVLKEFTPADEQMDDGYLVDTHYLSMQAQIKNYPIYISGLPRVYSFEHKLFEQRPKGWRKDCETNQNFLMQKFGLALQGAA